MTLLLMRRLVIILGLFLPTIGVAQDWEFGIFAGAPLYTGELTNNKPVVLSETKPGFGGFARYNVNKYFTVKSNIYYGTISGDDANASSRSDRIRNLSFRSDILDIGVQGEFNFSGFNTLKENLRSSFYGLLGLSVFRFNPRAKYKGKWYDLQELGTEGQGTAKFNERDPYALTQIAIPFGVGFKHAFDKHWSIGLEVGFRYTFTDYIDDVSKTYVSPSILRGTNGKISPKLSNRTGEVLEDGRKELNSQDQRGDPTTNDGYHFVGLTLSYTVIPDNCFKF
jgi:hypothetical protein